MNSSHPPLQRSFFKWVRQKIYPFFWFVAAADETLLHECPAPEQDKHAGVGMTIVCTTIAAIISSFYAIYSLFPNRLTALLTALFWGLIIFNLDRFMVSSIRKDKDKRWWREIKTAIPRFVLAFLIAILISKPIEIKIFQNQIQEAKSNFADSLQSAKFRFEYGELTKGRDERKAAEEYAEQVKEESNDVSRDATYRKYKNEYADCLNKKARVESRLDMRRRQKQQAIDNENQNEVERLNVEIQNLYRQIKALGCAAKKKLMDDQSETYTQTQLSRLATAQQRLDRINSRVDTAAVILKDKKDVADEAIENASKDILGQLRILNSLKKKDKGMMWAGLLITVLFLTLEVAPLLVKILSPRGEYDSLIAISEKEAMDNEEASGEESNQRKISRKKAALTNTAQTGEIDEKVKKQVQEKILNAQAELAEKIVDAWKLQEEKELQSNSEEYLKKMLSKVS